MNMRAWKWCGKFAWWSDPPLAYPETLSPAKGLRVALLWFALRLYSIII